MAGASIHPSQNPSVFVRANILGQQSLWPYWHYSYFTLRRGKRLGSLRIHISCELFQLCITPMKTSHGPIVLWPATVTTFYGSIFAFDPFAWMLLKWIGEYQMCWSTLGSKLVWWRVYQCFSLPCAGRTHGFLYTPGLSMTREYLHWSWVRTRIWGYTWSVADKCLLYTGRVSVSSCDQSWLGLTLSFRAEAKIKIFIFQGIPEAIKRKYR